MKIAFNGPLSSMRGTDWGTIRYALAHECLRSYEYLEFFKTDVQGYKKWEKSFIEYMNPECDDDVDLEDFVPRELILDNGADELGVGLSGSDLMYLIGALDPDIVILPDVLKKGPSTVHRSETFLAQAQSLPKQPKWMGVVQGRTLEEFIATWFYWLGHPDVSVIGIPYDMDFPIGDEDEETSGLNTYFGTTPSGGLEESALKGRLRASRRLKFLEGHVRSSVELLTKYGKSVHLLGSNDLIELFHLMRRPQYGTVLPFISSHDTTAPYAATQWRYSFSCDQEISFGEKGKHWPTVDFSSDDPTDEDLLESNFKSYFLATVPLSEWPRELAEKLSFEDTHHLLGQ